MRINILFVDSNIPVWIGVSLPERLDNLRQKQKYRYKFIARFTGTIC